MKAAGVACLTIDHDLLWADTYFWLSGVSCSIAMLYRISSFCLRLFVQRMKHFFKYYATQCCTVLQANSSNPTLCKALLVAPGQGQQARCCQVKWKVAWYVKQTDLSWGVRTPRIGDDWHALCRAPLESVWQPHRNYPIIFKPLSKSFGCRVDACQGRVFRLCIYLGSAACE